MDHFCIIPFQKRHIPQVVEFEKELRRQEPDTYFWDPDEAYRESLERSFSDGRFQNAVSFLAVDIDKDKVIGRIDAVIIAARSDPSCGSAYLDWICVLKSERHRRVGQALLEALKEKLAEKHVSLLIALAAQNEEAQRFYRATEGASMHDEGVWSEL